MVEDREKFERIRQEFSSRGFRSRLDAILPQECFYCGTKENLMYHHLVPVANGGDNRINNIICVCEEHHKAIHYKTHTLSSENFKNGKKWGCPKTPPPENYEYFIRKYLRGDIGVKDFWKLLKLPENKRMKISEKWWFKEFLKEHNIISYKNNMERIKTNPKRMSGKSMAAKVVFKSGNSYVKYKSGRTEFVTDNDSDDYKILILDKPTHNQEDKHHIINKERNRELAVYLNNILKE